MKKRIRSRFNHTAVNFLLIAIIGAIYFCMLSPSEPEAVASSSVIYRGYSDSAVSVQFAVSWDAPALGDILNTLDENSVRATFFVSGSWSENNPDTLRDIVRRGHEIGTLGYSPESDGNFEWLIEDISRSLDIIKKETGRDCALYYCGTRDTAESSRAGTALGLKNVRCTVDLLCARGSSRDIIERVPAVMRGGTILLMSPTGQAAQALPYVLRAACAQGMSIAPTGLLIK